MSNAKKVIKKLVQVITNSNKSIQENNKFIKYETFKSLCIGMRSDELIIAILIMEAIKQEKIELKTHKLLGEIVVEKQNVDS